MSHLPSLLALNPAARIAPVPRVARPRYPRRSLQPPFVSQFLAGPEPGPARGLHLERPRRRRDRLGWRWGAAQHC